MKHTYPESFEKLWNLYPQGGRIDKKVAYKKFISCVKDEADFIKAIHNYIGYLKEPQNADWLRPRHFKTFLTDWEQWLEYQPQIEGDDLTDFLRKIQDGT